MSDGPADDVVSEDEEDNPLDEDDDIPEDDCH
jgi:hypothetical protein